MSASASVDVKSPPTLVVTRGPMCDSAKTTKISLVISRIVGGLVAKCIPLVEQLHELETLARRAAGDPAIPHEYAKGSPYISEMCTLFNLLGTTLFLVCQGSEEKGIDLTNSTPLAFAMLTCDVENGDSLSALYVHPSWQRQGIAKALLRTIMNARDTRYPVSIDVGDHPSYAVAKAMYVKSGFKQTACHRFPGAPYPIWELKCPARVNGSGGELLPTLNGAASCATSTTTLLPIMDSAAHDKSSSQTKMEKPLGSTSIVDSAPMVSPFGAAFGVVAGPTTTGPVATMVATTPATTVAVAGPDNAPLPDSFYAANTFCVAITKI